MAPMKLKAKILMLAVAPLMLAIAIIGGLVVVETQRLDRQQAHDQKTFGRVAKMCYALEAWP